MIWFTVIMIFIILIVAGVPIMPISQGFQAWLPSSILFSLAIIWLVGCLIYWHRSNRVKVKNCYLHFDVRVPFMRYKDYPKESIPKLELDILFYRPPISPFSSEKKYIKDVVRLSWLNTNEAEKLSQYFQNLHKPRILKSKEREELILGTGDTPVKYTMELPAGRAQRTLLNKLSNNKKEGEKKLGEIEEICTRLEENFRITWTYTNGRKGSYQVSRRGKWYSLVKIVEGIPWLKSHCRGYWTI